MKGRSYNQLSQDQEYKKHQFELREARRKQQEKEELEKAKLRLQEEEAKRKQQELDDEARKFELELDFLLNEEEEEEAGEKEKAIIKEKKYKRYSQIFLPGMIQVDKGWVYPDEEIVEKGELELNLKGKDKQIEIKEVDIKENIPYQEEIKETKTELVAVDKGMKEEDIKENIIAEKKEIKAESSDVIKKENIGYKLLMKQGWKQGTGLGKRRDGRIEPIKSQEKKHYKTEELVNRIDMKIEDDKMVVDFDKYREKQMEMYRNRIPKHFKKDDEL